MPGSSANLGNQTVLPKYQTPLQGAVLAEFLTELIPPGVYPTAASPASPPLQGSLVSGQIQFTPGTVFIRDSAYNAPSNPTRIMVRAEFTSSFLVSVSRATPYVVLRYDYLPNPINFVYAQPVARANINPLTDIVLGLAIYDENEALRDFDNTQKKLTQPALLALDTGNFYVSALAPGPGITSLVNVTGGSFFSAHGSLVTVAGTQLSLTTADIYTIILDIETGMFRANPEATFSASPLKPTERILATVTTQTLTSALGSFPYVTAITNHANRLDWSHLDNMSAHGIVQNPTKLIGAVNIQSFYSTFRDSVQGVGQSEVPLFIVNSAVTGMPSGHTGIEWFVRSLSDGTSNVTLLATPFGSTDQYIGVVTDPAITVTPISWAGPLAPESEVLALSSLTSTIVLSARSTDYVLVAGSCSVLAINPTANIKVTLPPTSDFSGYRVKIINLSTGSYEITIQAATGDAVGQVGITSCYLANQVNSTFAYGGSFAGGQSFVELVAVPVFSYGTWAVVGGDFITEPATSADQAFSFGSYHQLISSGSWHVINGIYPQFPGWNGPISALVPGIPRSARAVRARIALPSSYGTMAFSYQNKSPPTSETPEPQATGGTTCVIDIPLDPNGNFYVASTYSFMIVAAFNVVIMGYFT